MYLPVCLQSLDGRAIRVDEAGRGRSSSSRGGSRGGFGGGGFGGRGRWRGYMQAKGRQFA